MKPVVREATINDLHAISRCRMRSFPGSLSTQLGEDYVSSMMKWYLNGRNFALMLEDGDRCIGLCTGQVVDGKDTGSSSHEIAENTRAAFIRGMLRKPWLVFHPNFIANLSVLKDLVKRKLMPASKRKQDELAFYDNKPERLKNSVDIVDICIDPDQQGKGFGSLLMQAFEAKTRQLGFHNMHLSVKPGNTNAIKAYQKNGWYIISENPVYIGMEKVLEPHS